MKLLPSLITCVIAFTLVGAGEKPVNFVPAANDSVVGDYAGDGAIVAQVSALPEKAGYQVTLRKGFDSTDKPVAVLKSAAAREPITFEGDGWTGSISSSHFTASSGDQHLDLKRAERTPPTLGAEPPKGAMVLFDGKNLDAWAKKAGKDWLKEDGPAQWKLVDGAAVEVVPNTDCLITHEKFGDCHLHAEFRTLGAPTNSGIFLQDRYEVNINESYGKSEGSANGGLDNCTENVQPRVRASLPPLAWQTFDIDFRAPRFDSAGKKTENARATVLLNGVKIYDNQPLDPPHGAAGRLGEAPTGPLMLQEHGMPVQFRNIWLVPAAS